MTKFRVLSKEKEDVTFMSNHHLREKEMSLDAKGLLSLMLSLPENWDCTIEGLTKINGDGKASISAAINELKEFGYLELVQTIDSKGASSEDEYVIHEKPIKPATI